MMEMDKMDIKWGNLYGYFFLPFFIGMRDDPLDYVRKAKAIANRKKLSLGSVFSASLTTIIMHVPLELR